MRFPKRVVVALVLAPLMFSTALADEPSGERKGDMAKRNRLPKQKDLLKVGDAAPDFTLSKLNSKEKVTLSDHRGKQPVVLVFGSYT